MSVPTETSLTTCHAGIAPPTARAAADYESTILWDLEDIVVDDPEGESLTAEKSVDENSPMPSKEPGADLMLSDKRPSVRPGVSNETLRRNNVSPGHNTKQSYLQIPYFEFRGGQLKPIREGDDRFIRRRILNPVEGGLKYWQPDGTKPHLYTPYRAYELMQEWGMIIITEGEFKAMALVESGFPAFAIGGIDVYQADGELLPELARLFTERTIDKLHFLGDADTALNAQFAQAACKFRHLVAKASPDTDFLLPRVPLHHLHKCKGIDDAREQMGDGPFMDFFKGLLKGAVEIGEKTEPDELAFRLFHRESVNLGVVFADSDSQQQDHLLKKILRLATRCRPSKVTDLAEICVRAGVVRTPGDFKRELKRQRHLDADGTEEKTQAWVEIHYLLSGTKPYAYRVDFDLYTMVDRRGALNRLKEAGYSDRNPGEGQLSETEQFLTNREKHPVDWAGPVAGRKAGIHEISGRKILVTRSPKLVSPTEGSWETIRSFLVGRLDFDPTDKPEQEQQTEQLTLQSPIFLSWLSRAVIDLYKHGGRYTPAQALVLVGPRRVGKNLMQSLITCVFGGRSEAPFDYMEGRTSFNGNLVGAEHWAVADENSQAGHFEKQKLKSFIKKFVANEFLSINRKYCEALSLNPFRRLTFTLNDDPESLKVLPDFSQNFEDKLIVLRVFDELLPFNSDTFHNWWAQIEAELPALVNALLQYEVPTELRDVNYGVKSYKNPDVFQELGEKSPEERFIDEVRPYLSSWVPWRGTSKQLIEHLRNSGYKFLGNPRYAKPHFVGKFLTALSEKFPDRYRKVGTINGTMTFEILPPGRDPNAQGGEVENG